MKHLRGATHALLILLLSGPLLIAQDATSVTPPRASAAPPPYLSAADTVWLDIAPDRRKYTVHTFAPGQTVYSLANFYAQDIAQLYALNPALAEAAPRVGDQVRVEVPNITITRFRGPAFRRDQFAPICYRVPPGQTAYHIARTVFHMPVDTLLSLSGRSDTELQPDDVLQVGWMQVGGAGARVPTLGRSPLQKESMRNAAYYREQTTAMSPRRGVASWTAGSGDASGKLFALTDVSTPGSYLRVTNQSNGRTVYVEVIGTLPTGIRKERIDLQLSGTAARLLEARQSNFYVLIE